MTETFKDVAAWSPEEVADWLGGLDESSVVPHIPQFVKAGVTGAQLLEVTFRELEQLGVSKVGHQEMILEAIDLLCALQSSLQEDAFEKLATSLLSASQRMVQLLTCTNGSSEDGACGDDKFTVLDCESQLTSTAAAILTSAKKLVTYLDRNAASHLKDYKALRQTLLQSVLSITSSNHQGSEGNAIQLTETCKTLTGLAQDLLSSYAAYGSQHELPFIRTVTLTPHGGRGLGFSIRATFEGMLVVSKIIPNSPAALSSLISVGDELVQVNGKAVVGWQLPRVVAALKQHRFSASVTLKHAASASENIGFLRRKSSTGAVSLSSQRSSISSLSSVESLRDSNESLDDDRVAADVKAGKDGETEEQNQEQQVSTHQTDTRQLEEPRLQDSGNSSANEQTEETEKQHKLETEDPAVMDDNQLEDEQQQQSKSGHTVTSVAAESDISDSAKAEPPTSAEPHPVDIGSSVKGHLLEAVVCSARVGVTQLEDSKPSGDTPEAESMSQNGVTQSEDCRPSGDTQEEDSKLKDSVTQSGDKMESGDEREQGIKSSDHSENNSMVTNDEPCSGNRDSLTEDCKLSPSLQRKRSSSSLPPTPMVVRVANLVPVREVSSARNSPSTSPHPKRRPTPWFPPPPREPHPDDVLAAAEKKISKLVQVEQTGQQVEQKQEALATVDAEHTGSAIPDVRKLSDAGEDENDGSSKTDGSSVAHPVLSEVQTVGDKVEAETKTEKEGEEKKTVDVIVENDDGERGDTVGQLVTGKKSANSSRGSSPSGQKSRLHTKISGASSSGSIHSIQSDDGGGWGYSTKVVGGVVTRFPMKHTEEKPDEVAEVVPDEASGGSKSRRGWSFRLKSFKIGKKKKKDKVEVSEETTKWQGIGAQDMIGEDSETSSITSGDVGCLRGKKSPSAKKKSYSPSVRRKKAQPSDESTKKKGDPSDSMAAVASNDLEVAAMTASVKSGLSLASDRQTSHSHAPLARSKSEQVPSSSPLHGKQSPGRQHHRLDMTRFSVYNQPPGDQKTKYGDLNEVVMRGQTVKEVTVTGKKEDTLPKWRPGSLSLGTPCPSIETPDCEGWLMKLGGSGVTPKNWRKRWFVLKSNYLYYYKTSFDQSALGVVTLPGYSMSLAPEIKRSFAFKATREKARTYYFVADNQEDMNKWMDNMAEATKYSGPLITDGGTGTPDTGSPAPSRASTTSGSMLGNTDDLSGHKSTLQ